MPLGDYAAEREVTIVVENALSFRAAKEMWSILDRIQHPAIACCWDVFNAALVGETPYLSVPTLNSKIHYCQVKDAKLGALGATYCKLGEGDVPVQKFLTRLRGIGYDGYVTVEWEKAWLPALAEPEEILPDSIKKLKEWAGQTGGRPRGVRQRAGGRAQEGGEEGEGGGGVGECQSCGAETSARSECSVAETAIGMRTLREKQRPARARGGSSEFCEVDARRLTSPRRSSGGPWWLSCPWGLPRSRTRRFRFPAGS